MSAAHAVKPGSIADGSAIARSTGQRSTGQPGIGLPGASRRNTDRSHLSIVGDRPTMVAVSPVVTGSPVAASIVSASAGRATATVAPRTRLRLTRRGRIVFTTLAALPIVFGSIAVAVNGGVAAAEGTAVVDVAAFDYITIEAGQSLWQLAESIAPTQDPRDVIAAIVNLNQLPSEAVQPGQRLALPAGY